MKKHIGFGVLALGACAVTTPALAEEDEGFYFGVGAGQSEVSDFDRGDLDDAFAFALIDNGLFPDAITSRTDDKDTSFSLFAGYRFLPYLAVELGYTDLGTATYRGSTPISTFFGDSLGQADATIDFESKGVVAAALGAYPFSDLFDVHGRLGLFFSDTELSVRVNFDDGLGGSGSGATRLSESAVDGFASIGAGFNFTPNWHLSLDFSVFSDVGDEDTGESNVQTLSLSLAYRL